jgi:hypothetical protein
MQKPVGGRRFGVGRESLGKAGTGSLDQARHHPLQPAVPAAITELDRRQFVINPVSHA